MSEKAVYFAASAANTSYISEPIRMDDSMLNMTSFSERHAQNSSSSLKSISYLLSKSFIKRPSSSSMSTSMLSHASTSHNASFLSRSHSMNHSFKLRNFFRIRSSPYNLALNSFAAPLESVH